VDSRLYNTMSQLCKAAQDLLLFAGGAMLGTGNVALGVLMLVMKVALTVLGEEVGYRRSYAITREVLEERMAEYSGSVYRFPRANPVELYVTVRSSRRGLRGAP